MVTDTKFVSADLHAPILEESVAAGGQHPVNVIDSLAQRWRVARQEGQRVLHIKVRSIMSVQA
jgi:hypothetical protein